MTEEPIACAALVLAMLSMLMQIPYISCAEEPVTVTETVEAVQETEPKETTETTEPETVPPTEAPTEPETEPVVPEYPAADTVWKKLRKRGYSDSVCAGILGNMMAECGGQTLALRWDAYGEGDCFYGICQWNKWTYPEVQGQDLEYQIDYLLGNIKGRFGSRYVDFLASSTPEDAALRFAVWYEGCAEWSYPVRKACAADAFEYFTEGG